MLSSWSIRKFLIRQPHAAEIRITRGDGDVQLVARSGNWSKTADTVRALEPELVELLDPQGRVIRAVRPGEEQDASETAPTAPNILSDNPDAAMLTHFANLIHRAYEHSTTVAFSRLIELVERIDARSDAIEARLERAEVAYRRTVNRQIEDSYDRVEEMLAEQAAATADGQPLDFESLLRVFAGGLGRAQAQTAQARKSASNGKGSPP